MYQLQLDKKVKKFLLAYPDLWRRFFIKAQAICKDPYNANVDIRSLKWASWSYRLRIGKYRFLYEVREKEIIIYFYDSDSRGDVY